jgi:Rod binding domain-containing protein
LKINPNQQPLTIEQQKKPYVEIAEGMEEQFTSHLIEQMKKGIPRENEPSSAQSYYEALLDQEYAKRMAHSDSGLGIKHAVLEQILPRHLKNQPRVNQQAQIEYNKVGSETIRPVSKELRNE